jgi:hypothetical protein
MVGLDVMTSMACFVAIKALLCLLFLSGKGCQTTYMIDNTVDFFKNDFDMYLM